MKLDLASLEVLEQVIDRGSVAAAAKRLHKAGSAISYHLRRLEEQLGVRILDRDGYRLALTPEGEAVLAEGRQILRKARALVAFAEQWREGWEAKLQIHFDGALPSTAIMAALEYLEREGAPTRIELTVGFLGEVQDRFEAGGGDIMISADPRQHDGLVWHQLQPLEFVLCCSASHRLARAERVTLDSLQDQTELVIAGAASSAGRIRPFFGCRRVYHLSDFHNKLDAIRQGLGFGWLPRYLAEPLLRSGEITQVPYEAGPSFALMPAIATRPGAMRGKATRAIVSHVLGRDAASLPAEC